MSGLMMGVGRLLWPVRPDLDRRLRPYRPGSALPVALRHGAPLLRERLRPYQT